MSRLVRGALIQATLSEPATSSVEKIKQSMIDKHVDMLAQAADKGAQVACFQELFYGPYFCAEQDAKWYELTEQVPDGPTTKLFQELAKKHNIVLVLPVYEEDLPGIYYNTAAVIDADGSYLGKFRKMHIPHCARGSGRSSTFAPATWATRCSIRAWAKWVFTSATTATSRRGPLPGSQRCGDRVQPVGHRRRLSEYLWKLEQPAHAVANQYFVGAINRPGFEDPWRIGEFYGQSYFCDPRGQFIAQASRDQDEIVIADIDLD